MVILVNREISPDIKRMLEYTGRDKDVLITLFFTKPIILSMPIWQNRN